jgi:hypothetical protein
MMPRYVCSLDGKFFEFSTVVEAPVTGLMDEAEFREYYAGVYGELKAANPGAEGLDARIDRARAFGTSSLMRRPGDTFEQWLEGNTRNTYPLGFPGLVKWKADSFVADDSHDPVETLRERNKPVDC